MNRLIFGCGYLGERVAKRWRDAGATVHVVTRSPERARQLADDGFQPLVADVTRPETLVDLPAAETVLFSVGYDRSAEASMAEVYAGGVKNVLAALPEVVGNFIYISTIGVYGSADGGWVDELTPPRPMREGGRASLAAEQELATHPLGKRSVALRLAGIYGPGRVPFLDKLRDGEPIAAPKEGWLNLIHVDDAATVVLAAETWLGQAQGDGPHLFCVTCDEPMVRGNYYREVARQIGAEPPQFVVPDPASSAAMHARVNRRISNEKMHKELGVRLAYPSYRQGLAAILPE
jgi:nucleoside-diphosphate-sugar epimerase